MSKIYNTGYKYASVNLLNAAAGKDKGTILNDALNVATDYADTRNRKMYEDSIKDKLASDDLSVLANIDTNKLTKTTADELVNRLNRLKVAKADKRQEVLFNQKMADRDAEKKYRDAYATQDNKVDTTDIELDLGGDLTFKPREQELMNKAFAGKKNGPNWEDTKSLVKILRSVGANDKDIKNIFDTHQRVIDWERNSDELAKSGLVNKTEYEKIKDSIDKVVAQGGVVTDSMYKRLRDAKAAEIETKKLKQNALTSSIADKQEALNKLLLDGAKIGSKGFASKKTKLYKGDGLTEKEWLKKKAEDVTGIAWASKALGIGDGADVYAIKDELNKRGYSDNKARYIIDNLVDPGFLDNSVPSPKEAQNEIAKLAKQYDAEYGGVAKDSSKYAAEVSKQVAALKRAIAADKAELETLGATTEDARKKYAEALFEGPHDSGWRPTKVIKTGRDPEGYNVKIKEDSDVETGDNQLVEGDKKMLLTEFYQLFDKKSKTEQDYKDLEKTAKLLDALGVKPKQRKGKTLLKEHKSAPKAPVWDDTKTLSAEELRRRNAPMSKFQRWLDNQARLIKQDARDLGREFGYHLGADVSALAGGMYRTGEFFTQPFVNGYNYLYGDTAKNPFTTFAEMSEDNARYYLKKLGIKGKDADSVINFQELLTPSGPAFGKISKFGKVSNTSSKLGRELAKKEAKKLAEKLAKKAAKEAKRAKKAEQAAVIKEAGEKRIRRSKGPTYYKKRIETLQEEMSHKTANKTLTKKEQKQYLDEILRATKKLKDLKKQ